MRSVMPRIKRVFSFAKVDAVLLMNTIYPTSNFLYLTGITGGLFEFNPLVVTPKREVLLTNPLEYEIASRERPREMEVRRIEAKRMADVYSELARYLRGKVVGVDGSSLPQRYYRLLKRYSGAKRFVDVSRAFYLAREVKGSDEIARISAANHIILRVLKEIPAYFKVGVSEKQIAARVDYLMRAYGADGPSFQTIVCFGENSALPHHAPTSAKLRANSLVLVDCGARYENYCSDVTRTFIFRPHKGTEKYRRMLEMLRIVKEAQDIAMAYIKTGEQARTAHLKAAEHIDTAAGGKYRGKFIHGLGHPLGIDVHDLGPRLSPIIHEKLREDMVTSNEPGIYVVGFGGVRIEDDVVVKKGCGRLV